MWICPGISTSVVPISSLAEVSVTEFKSKIIADSIWEGKRLTTFQLRYPRCPVHEQLLTHRMLSRNAASARAIPVRKMLEMVKASPVLPYQAARNRKGMQSGDPLPAYRVAAVNYIWMRVLDCALWGTGALGRVGLHKQWSNRLLTPFVHIDVVVTATEWSNFLALRLGRDSGAQEEIQMVAALIRDGLRDNEPTETQEHTPYVEPGEIDNPDDRFLVSAARCARVSYTPPDSAEKDIVRDLELANRLWVAKHLSPFEHCARPGLGWHANFYGWKSYRREHGR